MNDSLPVIGKDSGSGGLRSSLLPDVTSKLGQTILTNQETPSMNNPLSDTQIEDLLNKVNMNNVFLGMANKDQDLIVLMKDTIEFQKNFAEKREKLVHAITHNVKYLASIHTKNNNDLKQTKEHLGAVLKWNEKLQDENHALSEKVGVLQKDQDELNNKRDEINKMVIESQANKNEIE